VVSRFGDLSSVVFRALLAILVGLPMLMPPGMCLCEYLPCPDESSTIVDSVSVDENASECQSTHCRCGHRRHRPSAAQQPTRVVKRSAGIGVYSAPVPYSDRHHPGCPATIGPISVQASLRNTPVLMPIPMIAPEVAFSSVIDSNFTAPVQDTSSPPSNPRYIAHCSLLI
jgi:hypothetical protein